MKWIAHIFAKKTKINKDANVEFLISHIEFLTEKVEELEFKLHQMNEHESDNLRYIFK